MAQTTTTVRAAEIFADFSEKILSGGTNKAIVSQHFHRDETLSTSKDYYFDVDEGIAGGATEGTALTAGAVFPASTKVTFNLTEGVGEMKEVSKRAINSGLFQRISSDILRDAINIEDKDALINMCRRELTYLLKRGVNKMESDCIGTFANISQNVTNTGAALTLTDMMTAIYMLRIGRTTGYENQRGFILTQKQLNNIVTESAMNSTMSHLWTAQIGNNIVNAQGEANHMNGLHGSVMGFPVFAYDESFTLEANSSADGVGAFIVLGNPEMSPEDAADVDRMGFGNICFRERLHVDFTKSQDLRSLNLISGADYAVGELIDANGVALITDR